MIRFNYYTISNYENLPNPTLKVLQYFEISKLIGDVYGVTVNHFDNNQSTLLEEIKLSLGSQPSVHLHFLFFYYDAVTLCVLPFS